MCPHKYYKELWNQITVGVLYLAQCSSFCLIELTCSALKINYIKNNYFPIIQDLGFYSAGTAEIWR